MKKFFDERTICFSASVDADADSGKIIILLHLLTLSKFLCKLCFRSSLKASTDQKYLASKRCLEDMQACSESRREAKF